MKYWFIPLICVLLLSNLALAQDTLWLRRLSTGSDEIASGIASHGNDIIIVGSRVGSVNNDALFVKYNQMGDTLWTKTYISDFEDLPTDVCIDSAHNILVTGYEYLSKKSNNRYYKIPGKMKDLFKFLPNQDDTLFSLTLKYDSLGSIKWKRTAVNKQAIGITVDSGGNSYVSGTVLAGGGLDYWLVKYNPQGETVWTRTLNFLTVDVGYRITTDGEGNIIQTGSSGNGYIFDCYVIKYSPAGDTIWTRCFDLNDEDYGISIATDPENNIIVVGMTGSEPYFDFLIIKYNSQGDLLWSKTFDRNTMDEAIGVDCDMNNNIFVTGVSGANNIYDYLTIKYNPAGDTIWTAIYDNGNNDIAQDIACDDAGNPIVTGGSISPNGYDFLTIKYRGATGIEESKPASSDFHNGFRISSIAGQKSFIFYTQSSGYCQIKLYNSFGILEKEIYRGYLSQGAHRFSLSRLSAGIHFIKVESDPGKTTKHKLILVK